MRSRGSTKVRSSSRRRTRRREEGWLALRPRVTFTTYTLQQRSPRVPCSLQLPASRLQQLLKEFREFCSQDPVSASYQVCTFLIPWSGVSGVGHNGLEMEWFLCNHVVVTKCRIIQLLWWIFCKLYVVQSQSQPIL